MKIHLFWIDNNYKKTGRTANNYNLVVDMENKTYQQFVNPFYCYCKADDIEVKRKSDIVDYIKYLKDNDFKEVEKI